MEAVLGRGAHADRSRDNGPRAQRWTRSSVGNTDASWRFDPHLRRRSLASTVSPMSALFSAVALAGGYDRIGRAIAFRPVCPDPVLCLRISEPGPAANP